MSTTPERPARARMRRIAVVATCLIGLSLVFVAYVQPSMLLAMTDALWRCF